MNNYRKYYTSVLDELFNEELSSLVNTFVEHADGQNCPYGESKVSWYYEYKEER